MLNLTDIRTAVSSAQAADHADLNLSLSLLERSLELDILTDDEAQDWARHIRKQHRSALPDVDLAVYPGVQVLLEQDSERQTAAPQTKANTIKVANVPYQPRSRGRQLKTLVPENMATAVATVLEQLAQAVGDVDQYVTEKLCYDSVEELRRRLFAEQIDAIALCIWNLERNGSATIIGDMTGIGKGATNAGLIRYAVLNRNWMVVYVTNEDSLLYDHVKDLEISGNPGLRHFATNTNLRVTLPNGTKLSTRGNAQQQAEMERMAYGDGFDDYDIVFTTYSQLQTVKGQEPYRREFFRRIAPECLILWDESHEGGGKTAQGWRHRQFPNRAGFCRELCQLAQATVYSSATYAKDPEAISLYNRTDLGRVITDSDRLPELLERGGVPLQQACAVMLTEAGQYIRRERSFEGVDVETTVFPIDRSLYNRFATGLQLIRRFERHLPEIFKELDKEHKADAKRQTADGAVGDAGISSVHFTSIFHNLINQFMLMLVADASVADIERRVKAGEKI
ncbi:MAG: strawberry notch family protein, partial [Cyanobacteria bacterium P01_H01_bin.121]